MEVGTSQSAAAFFAEWTLALHITKENMNRGILKKILRKSSNLNFKKILKSGEKTSILTNHQCVSWPSHLLNYEGFSSGPKLNHNGAKRKLFHTVCFSKL